MTWIKTSERLPERFTKVLVAKNNSDLSVALYSDGLDCWASGTEFFHKDTITHWMPLPEPPKNEVD